MRVGIPGPFRYPQRLAEATLGFRDVELLVRRDSDQAMPVNQRKRTTALLVVGVCPILPPANGVEIEPVDVEE
jgi:hypothetical protein